MYDFDQAEGRLELAELIGEINRNGFAIVAVTQVGLLYTVFFRRKGRG